MESWSAAEGSQRPIDRCGADRVALRFLRESDFGGICRDATIAVSICFT
jgi:hypothetical protein